MNTSQSNFSEEERYLAYAVFLWEKGDWESAYLAYKKAIKVNPNSYQGYCGKGYVEQDLQQYENSLESYSIAIKIKSDYADAYINRATVYFLLNDLEQATRDAKIAESLYLNQGNQAGYLRSKNMIETLKKEKDNLPTDTSQGDSLDELLKDFSDYTEEIYKSYKLVDPRVERGMTNRVHQQEQKSQNQTQTAKAAQFYNEGNIRANMGMFEDALSMYDKAISLDRSNPMYFNNRAASLKRLGRFQESIDQYKQIACEFPAYGKIFLSIGSTSIEMGDYQSAVSAYKNFYSAFKEGKFDFHPMVGGLSQALQGDDLLQTVFLTSINYLSLQQQHLANQAFQEAINANDQVTSQDKYLKRSGFPSNQAHSKLELNSSSKKQPISTFSIEKRKILLSNIENYLKHQEWRKADAETAKFLQSFLGNHFWGLRIKLQLNDIYCIPQEELDFINKLWLNYSNGNYGFSVQKKIWQVMECPEYPNKQWGNFLKRLGWGWRWRWMMKTSKDNLPGTFPNLWITASTQSYCLFIILLCLVLFRGLIQIIFYYILLRRLKKIQSQMFISVLKRKYNC